jgi:hypothetical protein
MKGQARAMIPALIGITPLLLAGITGYVISSGGQQNTNIAETRAVTFEQHQRMELANSVRADAKAAAKEIGDNVAAELVIELTHTPSMLLAVSDAEMKERG